MGVANKDKGIVTLSQQEQELLTMLTGTDYDDSRQWKFYEIVSQLRYGDGNRIAATRSVIEYLETYIRQEDADPVEQSVFGKLLVRLRKESTQ